jgi:hypothetical protein
MATRTRHEPIELDSGDVIQPVRAYRLRGGYRLLVTEERAVWQEFTDATGTSYSKLASGQTWRDRCPTDDTITRSNACRAANFWGFDR